MFSYKTSYGDIAGKSSEMWIFKWYPDCHPERLLVCTESAVAPQGSFESLDWSSAADGPMAWMILTD